MMRCAAADEEECIEIVLGTGSLALLAATAAVIAAVWASGALYELLFLLTLPLQPVKLSLASEQVPLYDVVSATVCVADWLRVDELRLVIISPDGRIVYHGEIKTGGDGCMTVSFAVREAAEGFYTVAVVRRSVTLSTARFQVSGRPHQP